MFEKRFHRHVRILKVFLYKVDIKVVCQRKHVLLLAAYLSLTDFELDLMEKLLALLFNPNKWTGDATII